MSRIVAAALALALAGTGGMARATTLEEAIALAVANEPGLKRAEAEADAARARLSQAQASRLPSVSLSAQAGEGRTDFGEFFAFGEHQMSPRAASVKLEQPVFAGGALLAGVQRARADRGAADDMARSARLQLEARVAEAYGEVLVAEEAFRLNTRQVEVASELARQAGLRFESGEIPRTDRAQAEARAAEARAGVARAQGDLARARARFRSLTGQEPDALAPIGDGPEIPADLNAAIAAARSNSPDIAAARAGADAARAGVRQALGGYLPEVALFAEAGSQRDQFFPGYRADGYTVGVQARWTLFSSGLQSAKVAEASAHRRAAEATADEARLAVEEAVIGLWGAVQAADRMADAAGQQAAAAEAAEVSLGHEVRVGAKPLVALLDAQRETLGARAALARAQFARVVARYQLRAAAGAP